MDAFVPARGSVRGDRGAGGSWEVSQSPRSAVSARLRCPSGALAHAFAGNVACPAPHGGPTSPERSEGEVGGDIYSFW